MTKLKHTLGPWVCTDQYGSEIVAQNNTAVAQCLNIMTASAKQKKELNFLQFTDLDEIKSNAYLIAAAPDLLEALEDILSLYTEANGTTLKAEKAIAKAKGIE